MLDPISWAEEQNSFERMVERARQTVQIRENEERLRQEQQSQQQSFQVSLRNN